jgi:hypothetical protein
MMDTVKAEENRTAYDEFLTRLDRQMREALGMGPPLQPSDGDKPRRSQWPRSLAMSRRR